MSEVNAFSMTSCSAMMCPSQIAASIGDRDLMMPLLHAVVLNHHEEVGTSVKLLLSAGAVVDAACDDDPGYNSDCTALMWTSGCKCCSEPMELMLAAGADPCRQQLGDAYSPVHISAMAGNAVKCRRLIEASGGRGLTLKDSKGRTPCLAAASMGQTDTVKLLHEQYNVALTDCDTKGLTALHWAADGGHTALMRYLLQRGVDVDIVSPGADCDTLLTTSVLADSAAAVRLLIERGCDVNKLNADGLPAAYTAANGNRVEALTALLDSGKVSANSSTATGFTLLMQAVRQGSAAAATLLLSRGAAVNATDSDGHSALHYAVGHSFSAELAQLLLAAGADVHSCPHDGEPVLLRAATECDLELVRVLLAAGADAAYVHSDGRTCLQDAAAKSHLAVLRALLENGASAVVNRPVQMCKCCGPLVPLVVSRDPAIVKLLLAAGADVHVRSSCGSTCLHVAARHKHPVPVLCVMLHVSSSSRRTTRCSTVCVLAEGRSQSVIQC
jgi:uncharacterized protein